MQEKSHGSEIQECMEGLEGWSDASVEEVAGLAGQEGVQVCTGVLGRDKYILRIGNTPVFWQMGQLHQGKGRVLLEVTLGATFFVSR